MTDALTLNRWLSPAFPVGAFAWSHGLEAAVAAGWVSDEAELAEWLGDLIGLGSIRADSVLVAAGYHQRLGLAELDAEARAFAASAERLEETVEQGAAFCRTLREAGGPILPDLSYPVALGAAARAEGLALPVTLLLFQQAAAGNLVSAAIRLSVLGQSAGQRVLAGLGPRIESVASEVESGDLDLLTSATLLGDIAAMAHERLAPRLFRS